MGAKFTYKEYYLCFIDILGFSDHIVSLTKTKNDKGVKDTLRLIRELQNMQAEMEDKGLWFNSFSDSIIITTSADTVDNLDKLIWLTRDILARLILNRFLFRGAIVRDKLYRHNNAILGKAMIDAYLLESRIARHPRIILSQDTFNDARKLEMRKQKIRRDPDGPVSVHALHWLENFKTAVLEGRITGYDQKEQFAQISSISAFLAEKINEFVDRPSIFEKYKWFIDYFNHAALEFPSNMRPNPWPPRIVISDFF